MPPRNNPVLKEPLRGPRENEGTARKVLGFSGKNLSSVFSESPDTPVFGVFDEECARPEAGLVEEGELREERK
jgi:hypothetical protein